ncbi:F-box/LRR-repeat protein At4g14096 [Linum perenne]
MATAHLENCCSLNPSTIDKEMLVVSVPSLKSLTIIDTIGELCPIVIKAPSLEHLYLGDCTELQIVDSQLSCLVSARVDIGESCILERCMIQFLTQIFNAKQVYLSRQTLLFQGLVSDVELLPTFPNLTHLTLETAGSSCRILHSLLHSASKLQSLVIHLESDREATMKWESEPTCTPKCLLSSLEKLEINLKRSSRSLELKACLYVYECLSLLEDRALYLYSSFPELG